jgi:molecular chaperone DnaK
VTAESVLAYGIDLGGWNCTVAVARVTGVVVEQLAFQVIPAAAGVSADGRRFAGRPAEENLRHDPVRYRRGLIHRFGPHERVWLGDAPVATDELMALLLGELAAAAQQAVPGEPDRIAIAVPSGWGEARRETLLAAAKAAGLDPARTALVDRAVAAGSPAAADLGGDRQRHLLVYDLGATTFTASLLRRTGGGRLVAIGREAVRADLGAGQLDQELLDAMADRSPQVAELMEARAPDADQQHRIAGLNALAEAVKRQLGKRRQVSTYVTLVRPGFTFEAERDAIEEATRLLVAATIVTCEDLLARYGLSLSTVDVVVLAGGGANLPPVTRELARRGNADVPVEPELTVARGAAYWATGEFRTANERRRGAADVEASRPVPVTGRMPRMPVKPGIFALTLLLWLAWAASGGWFTVTHWHGPLARVTLGGGALLLVLLTAAHLRASFLADVAAMLVGVGVGGIHVVSLIVYGSRAIFGHTDVGWVPFVSMAVAGVAAIGLCVIAVDIGPETESAVPARWRAEQRRLGLSVIHQQASGRGPLPDLVTPLLADRPAARGFRPVEGPFEFAVVQGRTLLLGSAEPDARPTVESLKSAILDYVGEPPSATRFANKLRPRFLARQINVHCLLIGALTAESEKYVERTGAELPNHDRTFALPAISSTLAVVSESDLNTRMARLLDRADREYYLPLLERAAEAAGLRR